MTTTETLASRLAARKVEARQTYNRVIRIDAPSDADVAAMADAMAVLGIDDEQMTRDQSALAEVASLEAQAARQEELAAGQEEVIDKLERAREAVRRAEDEVRTLEIEYTSLLTHETRAGDLAHKATALRNRNAELFGIAEAAPATDRPVKMRNLIGQPEEVGAGSRVPSIGNPEPVC